MDTQILREFQKTLQAITSELMLFSPYLKEEYTLELDRQYFELNVDIVIADEPEGKKALSVIFEQLDRFSTLVAEVKAYLSIERIIEDSEKVFKYIQILLDDINHSINLLAHFGYGFQDDDGEIISENEWTKYRKELLTKGLKLRFLLNNQTIIDHSELITFRKLQLAIAAKLNYHKVEIEQMFANPDRLTYNKETDLPVLEGPRHRLVLMKELGLLQKLRDDYNHLNSQKFARLVGLLLGFASKAEIDTIRKEYSLIQHNRKAKGKGGLPLNKSSVDAVRTALASIGMSPKNLPDLD